MTLLSVSSHSSVDRVLARCSGGHRFNPVRDSDFFFVPCLCHVDQFTFHTSLPSLNSPSLFSYHAHDDFDSADSSMQDA